MNCAASNTVCTGCDVANGWYLDGTVCKTKAQFNANQGVYHGVLKRCKNANCINCKDYFDDCLACNTATGWFLQNGVCKKLADLQFYQGFDPQTQTIRNCTTTNCQDCKENYQVCVACPTGQTPEQNVCVRCSTDNCHSCPGDHRVCTRCDQPNSYWLKNNLCILEGYSIKRRGQPLLWYYRWSDLQLVHRRS